MAGAVGVALAAALCLAGSAVADRHCAPALERYFAARHAVLSGSDCAAGVAESLLHLGEAAGMARDCGCLPLRDRIDSVAGRARSEPRCEARADAVLAAEEALTRATEACH